MRIVILLAMTALPACAPTPQPPPPASLPAPNTPAIDKRDTATPEQTLAELKGDPITAFDLGLYRLRREFAPELEKSLRAQGLLRRNAAINNEDVLKAGFVLVGLSHAKVDPFGTLIEISVYTGDSGGAVASAQTISESQQLASRVVSIVRTYAGGPCAASDDPNVNKYASCQSAFYFYDWFVPPSISGFNQPIVGRNRAGYNVYSLVQIHAYGQLKGAHTIVFVNCVGPLIRDEVKCETSGD